MIKLEKTTFFTGFLACVMISLNTTIEASHYRYSTPETINQAKEHAIAQLKWAEESKRSWLDTIEERKKTLRSKPLTHYIIEKFGEIYGQQDRPRSPVPGVAVIEGPINLLYKIVTYSLFPLIAPLTIASGTTNWLLSRFGNDTIMERLVSLEYKDLHHFDNVQHYIKRLTTELEELENIAAQK